MWFKDLFKRQTNKSIASDDKPKSVYKEALEKCKNNEEMWVECKGYPNYQVSNMGDVLYTKKGTIVLQRETSNGSKIVSMRKDNKSITCSVAKLVATSFEIPNENDKKNVYHIGDIGNNRLDNLSFDEKYSVLFKYRENEKEYKKMNYKHIKLRCKNCNDIIEGDGKGTMIMCSCGKVAVDEVKPYYTRIIGNEEDFEVIEQSLYEEALEKCKNNEEMWVKIKGYEDYELSNLGNARKRNSDGTYKEIGYYDKFENRMKIQLTNEKTKKISSTTLASLMGTTFEIPNPKNRKQIMPNDGNTMNCRLDNLRYRHNKDKSEQAKIEYSDKERIDNELINKQIKQQQDNEKEIWKWVVGYERWYEVSNKGNVRKINDDGTKKLLKASDVKPNYTRGRIVNLTKAGENQKTRQICMLVAEAFNLKPTDDNKILYHIDGDINNDCLSNLTYDIKETEKYIEEQRKIKEEQERLEREKQEQENHKEELKNYLEENKEFLKEAKEMKQEITLKDIYNKIDELIEVIRDGRSIR